MEATQLLDKVSLLWQALELYARDARVPKLFTKPDRGLLKSSIVDSLSLPQRQRLDEIIDQLNSPPLMVKLESALKQDAVLVTEGEIGLLQRTREIRNAMEHGRTPTAPDVRDVNEALALLGRTLVHAGGVR